MGLFGDIGDIFGEVTGFGSNGNPNPHNTEPTVYAELYNDALNQINSVGTKDEDKKFRDSIQQTAQGQLADLENNAAGRKSNFMEDMSRGFGADMQNRARAAGGSGTMAQTMNAPGSMYDSQARATSHGLNDLYSQAVDDLGAIQGVQGNLNTQDFNRANAANNLRMSELSMRRGQGAINNENNFNSETAGRERRMNTFSGIAKGVGGAMQAAGGGFGG